VIAAVVLPLAAGDVSTAVVLASALSIISGLVCIGSGYLNAGVVTELLSKPIRIGYLNGIAILIFLSQLPKALGFSVEAESTVGEVGEVVSGVARGSVNPADLVISTVSILVILLFWRVNPAIPGVVVAVIGSVAAVEMFDLVNRGVETVGAIPPGLPPLTLPRVGIDQLGALFGGAIAVTLVSFADTGALSTATALKSGEQVDPNSEIKALGAANLLSGIFQGFPTSASSSRTAVAMSVGSKTQVTGLVAAAGITLIIIALPGLIADIPDATLAAIVITASFALFDWSSLAWLFRVRRSELLLSVAATIAVLVFGVLVGIAVAIGLSLANFIRRAWRPHSTELAKVRGVAGYHDLERHPEAEVIPGLLIVRYDAPLFFANAPDFGRRLQEMLRASDRPVHRVLVVGNAVTDIDSTGAEILDHVLVDLESKGLAFAFAGLKGPVKDRLRAYGLYERIGDDNFFPNTISAVESHLAGDRDGGEGDLIR
jgi:MFS superfamily sulfate permease-like transporter